MLFIIVHEDKKIHSNCCISLHFGEGRGNWQMHIHNVPFLNPYCTTLKAVAAVVP
jgi:hypothetical protein